MQKISGKEISREIIESLKERPAPQKILGAILVGENPASVSFLKKKKEVADELGIDFRIYEFPGDIKNDDIRKEVVKLAGNKKIGGLVVQLPLPEALNKYYAVNAIPREKDVDVLGERAIGAFYHNRNLVLPPSVATVEEILKRQEFDLGKSNVAVVGLGDLVGRPIGLWLTGKCGELVLLDSKSDSNVLIRADLIISGVGMAGIVKGDDLKEGAGVIDFGYYYSPEGKLSGDLSLGDEPDKLAFYTPTPGGTGPILVAKLMENFYKLNA
ncbi:bifunctional 5,10-methylenetetrahydrofolate dehydrogenase/5,10-methenyltetrahydrofolate cyclohydrolase [Patescibacteria group bacterium]|nr:bifunctional 5,10-methylenetetrahydrofolate dehydrogenase/5,10-methenyltetrahydrofolate cyclohydrolase [Patescibacteria group bacterium]